MKFRRNLYFSRVSSAPTLCPPPKLTHEGHILGMSTRPRKGSHCPKSPKLCRLSCSLITNIPSKVLNFSYFGTCKSPCEEIRQFFTGVSMRTPIHLFYLKSRQNRCRINGRKSALYWWQTTKHVLASLSATPGVISPDFLRESAPWPFTYIMGFVQFRLGLGRYNRKTPPGASRVNTI